MAEGVFSFLCLSAVFILFCSGWFPDLAQELEVSERVLITWLLLSLCFASLAPWTPFRGMEVHHGLWAPIMLLFIWGKHISLYTWTTLLSLSLCAGTLLYLWHELFQKNAGWSNPFFFLLVAALLPLMSLAFAEKLSEQLAFVFLSLFTLHGCFLFFQRDMLKPIPIGAEGFLDLVWSAFAGMILLRYPVRSGYLWLKKRSGKGFGLDKKG